MAEDLGTIKIAFGDAGRGPSETQASQRLVPGTSVPGPEGQVPGAAKEEKGEEQPTGAGAVVEAVKMVADAVGALKSFMVGGIAKIIEGGKFSAATTREGMVTQMQEMRTQMTLARVTDPMSVKTLQNWRQLMSLLFSWRVFLESLFQSTLQVITAILIGYQPIIEGLADFLSSALVAILEVLKSIMGFLAWYTGEISTESAKEARKAQRGYEELIRTAEAEGGVANALQLPLLRMLEESSRGGTITGGTFTTIEDGVGKVIETLQQVMANTRRTEENTRRMLQGSDMLSDDLLRIAERAPLFRERAAGSGVGDQAAFWKRAQGK